MNPQTGMLVRHDDPEVAVTGTLERLAGEALISGASLDNDGLASFAYQGETRVWWGEQRTVRDACGLLTFIDENGLELTQDQVALRLEDGELVFPLRFPVSL